MIKVNNKLKTIDKYVPSARKSGDNVVKLDWNECVLPIDKNFNKVLLDSLNTINLNEYPNINNKKLIEALANYCDVFYENIQIFNGSDSALHHIFATFTDENTKVLIYYPNYTQIETYIKLYTNNLFYSDIINPLNEHKYNLQSVENADIIYLSNPNNPTGICLGGDIIFNLVKRYPNKLFIIDEAYYEFSNKTCSIFVKNFDNIIITRTFSKAFSLASMRLGYICASPILIENINKIRNTKEVNTFAQNFGLIALENYHYIKNRVNLIIENREIFKKILNDKNISYADSEANFILVKVFNSGHLTKLLYENDILVRDRGMFRGLENTIRITVGTIEDINSTVKLINEQYENR